MTRLPISGEAGGKSAAAYVRLKEMAVNGELRPALQLKPADIAHRFGFSDTPVREALSRLYAEGFIDWRRSQGYYSKVFIEPEQRQLLEVCQDLLMASIASHSQARGEGLLRSLAELAPAALERDDSAEYVAAQVETMYVGLAEAGGNLVRLDLTRQMIERTHLVRVLDLRAREVATVTLEAMRGIARALLAHDPSTAGRLGRETLQSRIGRLARLVGEANAQAATSTFPDDGSARRWRPLEG
jgi:DNA-binding GntR family transcriptional regulator